MPPNPRRKHGGLLTYHNFVDNYSISGTLRMQLGVSPGWLSDPWVTRFHDLVPTGFSGCPRGGPSPDAQSASEGFLKMPPKTTQSETIGRLPLFLSVKQAAEVIGMPVSLIEKSFMDPAKRPAYAPPPPPHRRQGRSIYILTDGLAAWALALTVPTEPCILDKPRRRGRPTRAEQVAREAALATQDQLAA